MKTIKRQHYLLFTHNSFELIVKKLQIYNLVNTPYYELSLKRLKEFKTVFNQSYELLPEFIITLDM